MSNSGELAAFLQSYEQYATDVLTPTKAELDLLFKQWINSDWSSPTISRLPTPSPIYHVESRIKRPESVVDKIILDRLNVFPEKLAPKSLRTMNDTVAGRIIVYFLSNLSLIHNAIINEKRLQVSTKNPPVAFLSEELVDTLGLNGIKNKPKKSGYNAIHYVVKFKTSEVAPENRPWVEIQMRTLTEHVWGEIEHLLGYKPEKNPNATIKRQFQIISKQLCSIDEHFNLLFENLSKVQEEIKYSSEDLLNSENLAAVLKLIGLSCAQKEVERILKIFESRGLKYVKDIEDLATTERLDLIRNTYAELDMKPDNSEIIATLVAIKGLNDNSQIIEAIRTQISFHKAWATLKGEG